MSLDKPGQADIDAAVELITDQLDLWRESNKGDREGAVGVLLALLGRRDGLEFFSKPCEASDYLSAKIGHFR